MQQIQFVTELIFCPFVSPSHQFTRRLSIDDVNQYCATDSISFNSTALSEYGKSKWLVTGKVLKLYSELINESINNDQSTALNESTVKSVNVKSSSESTADQTVKSESESSANQTIMNEKVKCFLIMCLDDQLLSVVRICQMNQQLLYNSTAYRIS